MLRTLTVRRLAVIEDVQVEFNDGLNVLSGETGAGKSIIVTAIGLALGWRATSDLIRTGCDDAEIVAVFNDIAPAGRRTLEEEGLPTADPLTVRRVLQTTGRNRVEIAGQDVTLAALRRFGETMLNLYGQHEAQGLMRPESHMLYLDAYTSCAGDRNVLGDMVERLKDLDKEIARLTKQDADREARLGYLRFVIEEIDGAQIGEDEDEELAAEIKVLSHAENLIRTGRSVSEVLYDRDEGAVVESAGELLREVEEQVDVDARLGELQKGLEELVALAEDIAARGRDYAESLDFDPARLEQLQDRLYALGDLKKKYGGSLAEVSAMRERAVAEIAALDLVSSNLRNLADERLRLRDEVSAAARRLSGARRKAAKKMRREVERELADLDMSGTSFTVAVEPLSAGGLEIDGLRIDANGADEVEFLISANVGELPRPLARIASGGELSRIMLAIKRVLARHFPVPTLIFDEIDAGVGGAQAERLGRKLREVAGEHQVLCITHLPQIAAQADHHYLVEKTAIQGRTHTRVEALSAEGRVNELARMLGGEEITSAARANATSLMAATQPRR